MGIYNGVFTMWDEQTGTTWSHLDGVAIEGPLGGDQLALLPLVTTTWASWRAEYPDTTVLEINTEHQNQYRENLRIGADGLRGRFVDSIEQIDERLPLNELVIGVIAGDEARAFPISGSGGSAPMQATVGGVPVVILEDGDGQATLAYHRALSDSRVLDFERRDGALYDTETGTLWSATGLGLEGELTGVQLAFVTSFFTEWYGWAAFYPGTTIYGAI